MLVLWEEESLKMRKEGVVQQLPVSTAISRYDSLAVTCRSTLRLFHKRYQALHICVHANPSLIPRCLISSCFSAKKLENLILKLSLGIPEVVLIFLGFQYY